MATSSDLDTLIQLEEDEEEDFELTQRRIEAERAAREEEAFKRNTLHLDIPQLPDGKTHHLFISHSNDPPEEEAWAEELVNTMERDFGLKCLWPKRDFTPGHDVGALIQTGIMSSMKVVFVLSPASMESRWCEYERNFAFGISVESKENLIIPVMLSQCNFPGILKTLNYIDVPAGEDYAFKIRRCFDEDTRTFEYLVPEMMKHWKNDNGSKNGTVVKIVGERNVKSICREPAWSFRDLDKHQRYQLRQLGSKMEKRLRARLRAYSIERVFETNILIDYKSRKCQPNLDVTYYDLQPCMKYLCDIIDGPREAGETVPDRGEEGGTRNTGKRYILSLIERNYDFLFGDSVDTSVVDRHPTAHKHKCICEMLEKHVRQMSEEQI
ncbi:uncharacterized protein LOC124291490 [Haliotis rubra]|uniref:uncharacterized protein LOC124291490 n=1 Tax=Haliotis rubra TaxID=36100 RepID=UPI001EE530FF|nr:uncharacterized protein LOC124291490 [Haliotis rubra]